MSDSKNALDLLPAALGADADAMYCLFTVVDKVAANCAASNRTVFEAVAYALHVVTEEFDPKADGANAEMRARIDGLRASSR